MQTFFALTVKIGTIYNFFSIKKWWYFFHRSLFSPDYVQTSATTNDLDKTVANALAVTSWVVVALFLYYLSS
jgi:hypothetical protein